jgi:hypothetical protein
MSLSTARQPIIILGMHRSGTSMIAELLDALGLFVGRRLQDDHESTFFLSLNETIFARVGASWDNPLPMRAFLDCTEAVDMTAKALAADLSSRRIGEFFGSTGLFASRPTLESFNRPWGWKDPRTIFTLPIWLRLFPEAKLIYILRNGVDVASSLIVRERKLLKNRQERFESRLSKRTSSRSALERAGYKGSPRCLSLEGSFGLWREYLEEGERQLNGLKISIHTVRYEDILEHPQKHFSAMARFAGLSVDDAAVQAVVGRVNASRARAFTTDPVLAAFFEQVRSEPWMVRYDYHSS